MTTARKQKKLTQAELAREVNVSQRSVAAYEAAERTPNTRTAKKIGAVLEVPWIRFYEDDDQGEKREGKEGGETGC